jgi:hypothetical protein
VRIAHIRHVGVWRLKAGEDWLRMMGLPTRDAYSLPTSQERFPDGGSFRIEIASTEGPDVFRAVLDSAKRLQVPIHRVSQGSGIMMLTDEELAEMARLGAEEAVEVSLFIGPRGSFDTGVQATSAGAGSVIGKLRGMDQLAYALEEVRRAAAFGIRSILVADEAVIQLVSELRAQGKLPADFVVKTSVLMGTANPVSVRIAEQIGANSVNLPVDLPLPAIAAIRQVVQVPLDIYMESPDDVGGVVRHYEAAEVARVAAPVYLKFGVRNSVDLYPVGEQLKDQALALGRERVRRARLVLELLSRLSPDIKPSPLQPGRPGVPVLPTGVNIAKA